MNEQKIGDDFLTDEQRSSVATSQFLVDNANQNITSDSISDTGEDLFVPESPQTTDQTGVIDQQLAGLQQGVSTIDSQIAGTETQSDDLRTQLLETLSGLGEEQARTQELEQQAGLGIQRKELQNVINELQTLQKEAAAIPLSIQEEFAGRGATAAGVEPIQTGRLRQNAIKALSFAAIGQTLQGNISLAEQTIARAIDAEFEPQRQKLEVLGQLYKFNREDLERIDKKRSDQLGLYLDERKRVLDIQQADKQEIYNIGTIAQQYGADTQTVQAIFEAKTRKEAVLLAGKYLQDPLAKQDLINARLENELKRAQINKVARETALLGKDAQNQLTIDTQRASDAVRAGEDHIATLNGLRNHKGMTKAVGSYKIARWTPLQVDKSAVNDFVSGVEQYIDQLTLDKLIESKAQGATFGALSDRELQVIASAATKISGYRRTRDDGSVYFEVDEATFRAELLNLQTKIQDAVNRKRGGILDAGEVSVLDEAFPDNQTQPDDYFGITSTTQATNF